MNLRQEATDRRKHSFGDWSHDHLSQHKSDIGGMRVAALIEMQKEVMHKC